MNDEILHRQYFSLCFLHDQIIGPVFVVDQLQHAVSLFLNTTGHVLDRLPVVHMNGEDLSLFQLLQGNFRFDEGDRAYNIGNVDCIRNPEFCLLFLLS